MTVAVLRCYGRGEAAPTRAIDREWQIECLESSPSIRIPVSIANSTIGPIKRLR
jgi:hypothetical protein